ncbi:MAG: group 1 glycosyl transferase [Acidobacteria bacterium]|nr:group 1 glycosyl transferase [Acidobacteriota bacterium]
MSGFSADWLALREPADHAARSGALAQAVFDAVPRGAPLRILDLAAGTGSNLRYLTAIDRTPRAEWLLVDHDAALLARVPASPDVTTRCLDLSALDHGGIFAGRSIVTASALLDLVSETWLRAVAARCADAGAAVLFALSYDGRIVCSPEDPEDGSVVALVNEHQRHDKGFGPALGPAATEAAARCFAANGYRVQRAASDWILPPDSRELQSQLIDGWAQAAAEIAPERARTIDGWRDRRLAHVAAGWSHIVVGHEDFGGILGSEDLRI